MGRIRYRTIGACPPTCIAIAPCSQKSLGIVSVPGYRRFALVPVNRHGPFDGPDHNVNPVRTGGRGTRRYSTCGAHNGGKRNRQS